VLSHFTQLNFAFKVCEKYYSSLALIIFTLAIIFFEFFILYN